jgi:hypothetical protein
MAKPKTPARKRPQRVRGSLLREPRTGLSPDQFCQRYGISRSTFEDWRRRGVGPAELQPLGRGGRIIITEQAEADWLAKRTAFASIAEATA